jgi:NTP pyrophosphatase (non-canonical NTP hydrolase)
VKKTPQKNKLSFEELLSFIETYDAYFKRRHRASRNYRILGRMTKLAEETGELASAVLASLGHQRSVKLRRFLDHHLAEEVADVIITVMVLADTLGVDVREALRKKMTKIKQRVRGW